MSRRIPPRSFVDVLTENLEEKTKIRVRVIRIGYLKERYEHRPGKAGKPVRSGQYIDYKYRISAGPEGRETVSGEMNINQAKMMLAFMCDFANLTDALARGMLAPVAPTPPA